VRDHESRCRKTEGYGCALERVLVVEHRRRQRVVPDIGNAHHLQHRGRVRERIAALDSAGIEPGHVDAALPQPIAQSHVLGHELDVAKTEPPQRGCDIAGNRLVALPGARIVRLVDHASGRGLVAAEDDGKMHAGFQPLDPMLQSKQIGAIRRSWHTGRILLRVHDAPIFREPMCVMTGKA
jgi:hypothetical protein